MNIILFERGTTFFPSSDERCMHIRRVLHLGVGDSFVAGIFNGDRGLATITSDDGKGIEFTFTPTGFDGNLYPLTVILAAVRPICMKRILRELVSLGVSRMIITNTELGEKSYLESGLYKSGEYLEIMKSGAMQSGHTGLSEAVFARTLEEAIGKVDTSSCRILFDLKSDVDSLRSLPAQKSFTIAIGGERGWTDRERDLFRENGFTSTALGSRILRSETAAVAASALALAHLGAI